VRSRRAIAAGQIHQIHQMHVRQFACVVHRAPGARNGIEVGGDLTDAYRLRKRFLQEW